MILMDIIFMACVIIGICHFDSDFHRERNLLNYEVSDFSPTKVGFEMTST